MNFAFTDEHAELRKTVRKFLENQSDEQAVRALMATDPGYDADAWKQMAEQMGLQGLIVPEEHGGAGLGPVELLIVLEEMGRSLYCGPYLSTAVLSVSALTHATDDARGDLLSGIASGQRIVALAWAEEGRWGLDGVQAKATKDGSGWRLEGTKRFVLDGHTADTLLVVARMDDGLGLFAVDGDAPALERTLLPTFDLTRKLADVSFSETPARRLGDGKALDRTLTLGIVALAAEQAGGAERCLEMSTEYAKTRYQFGRPIGSFQAIKHKCADMLLEVEFAKSAAYFAAFRAAEKGADDLLEAAHMAKAYCSEAFVHAAGQTIQIHGGMGFTWEHPAHLYLKRAKASALLFGDAAEHRERLAEQIGI